MPNFRLDRILVVDFEQTCWEAMPPPAQQSEIIEFGIAEVLLDGKARLGRQAAYLVKPENSAISAYCTGLTGITPAMVRKQGRSLGEVCNTVRKEFGGAAKAWAAWGQDNIDIARDCAALGIVSPLSDNFINLGQLWGLLSGSKRNPGLLAALNAVGMEFTGTHHRAGDDASNTARLLIELADVLRFRLSAELTQAPAGDAVGPPGPGR